MSDQNGETPRAAEWGMFLVQAAGRSPRWADARHWHPATSFGDLGTAAPAVASGLVVRGFARGYAPAPAAVVLASAGDGRRGAIRIVEAT